MVPFYVGKGTGKRAWNTSARSKEFKEEFSKGGCIVEIIDEFILDSQALAHEMVLIEKYGRRELGGLLVNKTDGGEATHGMIHSDETRAKMGEANRKHYSDPTVRARISRFQRNRTPEHRAKLAASLRGRTVSAETRAKISKNKRGEKHHYFGKSFSPAHRANLSGSHLKRWQDNPYLHVIASQRQSEALSTPEHSAKMRDVRRMSPPNALSRSGLKGVTFNKKRNNWAAQIEYGGKNHWLGRHETSVDAARAYDAAAIAAWGIGNCYLNYPEEAALGMVG